MNYFMHYIYLPKYMRSNTQPKHKEELVSNPRFRKIYEETLNADSFCAASNYRLFLVKDVHWGLL